MIRGHHAHRCVQLPYTYLYKDDAPYGCQARRSCPSSRAYPYELFRIGSWSLQGIGGSILASGRRAEDTAVIGIVDVDEHTMRRRRP